MKYSRRHLSLALGVVLAFPLGFLPSQASQVQPSPVFESEPLTEEESSEPLSDEEALNEDIAFIARQRGVSVAAVEKEFELAEEGGELQQELSAEYSDEFGGLFISEETGELTVAWKGDVKDLPSELRSDDITVVPAAFSEEELNQAVELAAEQLRQVDAEIWTDVTENQVVVEVDSSDISTAKAALTPKAKDARSSAKVQNVPVSPIVIRESESLSTVEKAIVAGKATRTCTAGFTVVKPSTGVRYLTTAGHCNDSQTFDGTSTTFVKDWESGNVDFQLHKPSSGNSASPKFLANGSTRTVTGQKTYSSVVVGSSVCKQGKKTGYTCGKITSKKATGVDNNTGGKSFIKVNRNIDDSGKISDKGDSGGPWFMGNTAYGWHHSGVSNGSFSKFMSVSFLPSGYSLAIG